MCQNDIFAHSIELHSFFYFVNVFRFHSCCYVSHLSFIFHFDFVDLLLDFRSPTRAVRSLIAGCQLTKLIWLCVVCVRIIACIVSFIYAAPSSSLWRRLLQIIYKMLTFFSFFFFFILLPLKMSNTKTIF